MFKGLIDDFKSSVASFLGTYLAMASVAVLFLIALGLATAAVGLELTERFGGKNALWMLAGGFLAIGLLASLVVTVKEHQHEMAAEEEQAEESGIGDMTSAAATQAATYLPSWLWGTFLNNPSTSALQIGRLVGRNMPLVLLLLLVAVLFWPTDSAEEGGEREGGSDGAQKDPSEEEPLQEAA